MRRLELQRYPKERNKIIYIFLFFELLFLISFAYSQLSIGTTAPDFSLPYLDGFGKFTLSENLGLRTIIYFWSPISEPMKDQMLLLQSFYSEYVGNGVQVVAVLSFLGPGDIDMATSFIKKKSINFNNLYDNRNVAKDYKISSTPAVVVLDENRKVTASCLDITDSLLGKIKEELTIVRRQKEKEFSKTIRGEEKRRTSEYRAPRLPSPFPYGLAGAGLNALLPGLGGVIFEGFSDKSQAQGCVGISASGFYLAGLFYLIDILAKPNNFYTLQDKKKYEDIVKVELYITAGFYTLNIISGYLAGADYARRR